MSKLNKQGPKTDTKATTEAEAFEMIELAIDDVEVLTRAFNLISEICDEANSQKEFPSLEKAIPETMIN